MPCILHISTGGIREMDNGTLSRIIEVEKELQERFESEKKRSQEWLDRLRREYEKELKAEEERAEELLAKSVNDSRIRAERKASEIIDNARKKAWYLKSLNDDNLKAILVRHINKILPWEKDDSTDVKD
jgi:vacuolar-type H+-ATPase subunit H